MSDSTRIDELLLRYRELQEQGQSPTPEELCADCPELLPAVKQALERERCETVAPRLASRTTPPHIPGYSILSALGAGGMGIVYKAVHEKLKRIVSLKVIRPGADADAAELARFRVEAEAIARLQHPNIVQIFDIGEHPDGPFLCLEFVEGGDLKFKLGEGPLPPRQSAEILKTLARAVQYAHEHGVIHRDLKPGNILLDTNGTPKITDFGLAKQIENDASLTGTGHILGTPQYMAPEQARGSSDQVGPAADIYSLGAILYECLTGRPPFKATSIIETLDQVRWHQPVPPRHLQPDVPRDLETICLKCLEKDPAKRYPSALALADDLERFLDAKAISARPVGWVERTVKWVRRQPAVATLLLVSSLLLAAVASYALASSALSAPSILERLWPTLGLGLLLAVPVGATAYVGYRLWRRLRRRESKPTSQPPRAAAAASAASRAAPASVPSVALTPPPSSSPPGSLPVDAGAGQTPPPADRPPSSDGFFPQRFGKYELLRKLGQGETGIVYLARHVEQGWQAALKILPGARFARPSNLQRLLRLARTGATLRHPNVCQILDAGMEAGEFYLVMEYVEGQTLLARLGEESGNGLPLPLACYYASQLFDALDYLGRHSVVHRDVKPANFMVCASDRIKLMDLSLAKSADAEAQRLTMSGIILGTPAYMAPEQLRDASAATPRSDLYAAGVTLFEMVTGSRPFRADSAGKLLQQILNEAPPDPSTLRPDLPEALARIILRLLDKDPQQRPDPREVLDLLETVGNGVPTLPPRDAPVVVPGPHTDTPSVADGKAASLLRRVELAAADVAHADGDELLELLPKEEGKPCLGNYHLVERIGPRAAVNTYRARHFLSEHPHVVRLLPPALGHLDPARLRDLLGQSERLKQLTAGSPCLASLLEIGKARVAAATFHTLYYLVEECLPGVTFEALLANPHAGRPNFAEREACLLHALNGLHVLHRAGFLHGNLHPGKFFYDAEARRLALADFSRARPIAAPPPNPRERDGVEPGTINDLDCLGEHARVRRRYRAPELFGGCAAVSPLTEQYALGAIFIEVLAGRRRQTDENDLKLMLGVREDLQKGLADIDDTSPRLAGVLRRMVAFDSGERFSDLGAVLTALTPGDALGRYDLFVSYRRKNGAEAARAIVERLKALDVRAFMDVNSLDSGPFDEQLLGTIANTPTFVVILSEGSLDRCAYEGDWLRREIAHAIAKARNVVPVVMPGFSWDRNDSTPLELPADMAVLPRYQAVAYSHDYFDQFIERLSKYLKRATV